MTNQEAINYLLDPLSLPESMDIKDKLKWHEDAVNMAIEALKAQEVPSVQPEKRTEERTETHACDYIERQAAIDLWEQYHPYIAIKACEYDAKLRQLPSIQPEAKTNANGDWVILNKGKILKAGMEGREVDFRIGGRLFAIREKAQ